MLYIAKIENNTGLSTLFEGYEISEWLNELNGKLQPGMTVIYVGYSDYGGSLYDRAIIEFCQKNYPQNIVSEPTAYNGQKAVIFGTDDFLEELKYDSEELYCELQQEMRNEEINSFCEYYNLERTNELNEYLDGWFYMNSSVYPGMVDYNDSELIKDLAKNGFIKEDKPAA